MGIYVSSTPAWTMRQLPHCEDCYTEKPCSSPHTQKKKKKKKGKTKIEKEMFHNGHSGRLMKSQHCRGTGPSVKALSPAKDTIKLCHIFSYRAFCTLT